MTKLIDNVKTDDLSEEQKRLLAELISKEMMKKIESAVLSNNAGVIDSIKNLIKTDDDDK